MSSKSGSKALVTTLAGSLFLAGSSFAMTAMANGYMLDASMPESGATDQKAAEGKCGEGKCGIAKMDTDKDGKVSKAEFAAAHDGKDDQFAAHDPNGDGFMDADEFKAHKEAKGSDKAKMEGKCGEGKCGGSA